MDFQVYGLQSQISDLPELQLFSAESARYGSKFADLKAGQSASIRFRLQR